MSILRIKVTDHSANIIVGGNMAHIAREIGHLALENEEFALALNMAMIPVNEQISIVHMRDELIGMVVNP